MTACVVHTASQNGLVAQYRLFLNITHFMIALSAAAADHNSPVTQGLHHRPTREYHNPLRGQGETSPQVGICKV